MKPETLAEGALVACLVGLFVILALVLWGIQ
jgi:hypothetical protein